MKRILLLIILLTGMLIVFSSCANEKPINEPDGNLDYVDLSKMDNWELIYPLTKAINRPVNEIEGVSNFELGWYEYDYSNEIYYYLENPENGLKYFIDYDGMSDLSGEEICTGFEGEMKLFLPDVEWPDYDSGYIDKRPVYIVETEKCLKLYLGMNFILDANGYNAEINDMYFVIGHMDGLIDSGTRFSVSRFSDEGLPAHMRSH